ncbi:unnamed protein product [Medioppia subpectinata]|uniref:Uncharacterized protein n=1 Tax=Medioppia subpectinata TaxID=1979941 RepID=A0A7R9L435_9ACAR|nr:unnamed protein product [Medioppia subpectinata]CAG2114005.1 unnamed protein product [Medioppia subpectinata]
MNIRIDRTDSAVVLPFNEVYNEIQKQLKHNITSNTHVFEIFDTDFNEYCIITSDNHVIENLSRLRSRLRVRPKTVNNESIGLGINRDSNVGHKYSHKIQYEKNELNLNENNFNKCEDSINDYEDREETEGSTAGDNTSLSVCTNSESNSDSLPPPEPQSPTPPLPPKLPQKMPENVIKEFNAENGIKVTDRDDNSDQSIAPVVNSSLTKTMGAKKSRFSFTKFVTNAGYYVKQSLGLSTRTGDGVGNETVAAGQFNTGQQIVTPVTVATPSVTSIPSPLAPGSHPSAPINYLDVELNAETFSTTGSSPHMPYITFTACVGTVWVTRIRFCADEYRAVVRLAQILSARASARDPDVIVRQMAKSGFDDWDYDKCLNYFYNALHLYKTCLANCPNRETAATVYPLFNTMHSFVPYFLMTADAFGELNELRREFTDKCDQSGKNDLANHTISTQIGHQLMDNTTLEPPVLDIIQPKYASITRTTSEQNPIDYLALPVTGPLRYVRPKQLLVLFKGTHHLNRFVNTTAQMGKNE